MVLQSLAIKLGMFLFADNYQCHPTIVGFHHDANSLRLVHLGNGGHQNLRDVLHAVEIVVME